MDAQLAITVSRFTFLPMPNHDTPDLQIKQLLALNRAALAITGELELDRVLQLIVDAARELAGCKYSALGVLGEDGYIERFPTSGISDADREKIGDPPRGHGLLGVMLRAGRTLRIPDINKDDRRVGFPTHHPPMTSLLGVPIFVQGKLVGDLYMTDKLGQPEFSEEDEWLLELLAGHAATALTNAQLHREAELGREAAEREQQRLREVEQMKDEFLSTAAHELRTPLTTIRMASSLLDEQIHAQLQNGGEAGELNPRLLDLVGLIEDGSARMHSLVNDLLDLTRLEQGRATLQMEEFDIREAVDSAVESISPLLESKEQKAVLRLPELGGRVRGDRPRLEQVLINLLSNAHKYSPPGSPIEVRITRSARGDDHKECLISVRDSGPGVPEDERELIFERFYRSSLHRQDRTPSTGLGLPIARKVAEMHGGRVWVEPAPGGGSIFTLALPTA